MDPLSLLLWLRNHSIVLMLSVFVLIVLTTYWPGRKSHMERNARIPLDEGR